MTKIYLAIIIVLLIITFFYCGKLFIFMLFLIGLSLVGNQVYETIGGCETETQQNWRQYISQENWQHTIDYLKNQKYIVSTHVTGGEGDIMACIKFVEVLSNVINVPKENIKCIFLMDIKKEIWLENDKTYTKRYKETITNDGKITYLVPEYNDKLIYEETIDDGSNLPINSGKLKNINEKLMPLVHDIKYYFNKSFGNKYQNMFPDHFKISFASQLDNLDGDIVIGETQLNKDPKSQSLNILTWLYEDIGVSKKFNLGFIKENPGSLGMNLTIDIKNLIGKKEFLTQKGWIKYIDLPIHFCYMVSLEKKASFIARLASLYRNTNKKEVLIILNKDSEIIIKEKLMKEFMKLYSEILGEINLVRVENVISIKNSNNIQFPLIHIVESGRLSHNDFLNVINISNYIVGCTGDQSTAEVIALNKLPYHETPDFPLLGSIVTWCHNFNVIPEAMFFTGDTGYGGSNYDNLSAYKKYSKLDYSIIGKYLLDINYEKLITNLNNNYLNVVEELKKEYELNTNLPGAIMYCMKLKKTIK